MPLIYATAELKWTSTHHACNLIKAASKSDCELAPTEKSLKMMNSVYEKEFDIAEH
jgi:hypothetical protein